MRYSFRLAELLDHVPDPKRRPGTIKAICDYTGLDRHQVAALLKNEAKYIPLDALSRLCDFLIEHGHAAPGSLPGALFAIEAEDFWELLARRRRLEFCLGVRSAPDWPEGAWMRAGDSLMLGELLKGVTTLGGTAPLRSGGDDSLRSGQTSLPHLEALEQSLVWAPKAGVSDAVVRQRAHEVYDQFAATAGGRALLCLGSVKSNPVVELILSETFGCRAWQSEDKVASPDRRGCPIFLRYRDDDPQPVSSSGGMRLSKSGPESKPGIYYERADGTWGHCPWVEGRRDVALVFYVHRESLGRLEMVLCGFTGGATRLLARTLTNQAQEFWPPVYSGQGLKIGAFLVEFTLEPDGQEQDILTTTPVASHNVISLDPEVIARRLEQSGGANRTKE